MSPLSKECVDLLNQPGPNAHQTMLDYWSRRAKIICNQKRIADVDDASQAAIEHWMQALNKTIQDSKKARDLNNPAQFMAWSKTVIGNFLKRPSSSPEEPTETEKLDRLKVFVDDALGEQVNAPTHPEYRIRQFEALIVFASALFRLPDNKRRIYMLHLADFSQDQISRHTRFKSIEVLNSQALAMWNKDWKSDGAGRADGRGHGERILRQPSTIKQSSSNKLSFSKFIPDHDVPLLNSDYPLVSEAIRRRQEAPGDRLLDLLHDVERFDLFIGRLIGIWDSVLAEIFSRTLEEHRAHLRSVIADLERKLRAPHEHDRCGGARESPESSIMLMDHLQSDDAVSWGTSHDQIAAARKIATFGIHHGVHEMLPQVILPFDFDKELMQVESNPESTLIRLLDNPIVHQALARGRYATLEKSWRLSAAKGEVSSGMVVTRDLVRKMHTLTESTREYFRQLFEVNLPTQVMRSTTPRRQTREAQGQLKVGFDLATALRSCPMDSVFVWQLDGHVLYPLFSDDFSSADHGLRNRMGSPVLTLRSGDDATRATLVVAKIPSRLLPAIVDKKWDREVTPWLIERVDSQNMEGIDVQCVELDLIPSSH